MKIRRLALALCAGLSAVAAVTFLLSLSDSHSMVAHQTEFGGLRTSRFKHPEKTSLNAATPIHYVAITGTDGGDCSTPSGACRTIQYAVDQTGDGDEIRVATGVFTHVQGRPAPPGYAGPAVITQVVYLDKSITLRGGYTTTDWLASNPETYPTTLDAEHRGRVLFVAGDVSPTVQGLQITGGDATGLGGFVADDDYGGGVYVISATVTISDNHLLENSSQFGGGLFSLKSNNGVIRSNTIISNTGRGLYLIGADGVVVSSNTIKSNSGGGMYLSFTDNAAVIDNTITANHADNQGGGVEFYHSTVVFEGNSVISNSAKSGGGLWSSGSITINSNTILSNSATYHGGGIYLSYVGSNSTVSENDIVSNNAGEQGGGLKLFVSNPTIRDNVIAANRAKYGGGLHFEETMFPSITHNSFVSNTAWVDGGGLYFDFTHGATLDGNDISANNALARGGGLHLDSSEVTMSGDVISANTADSGGGSYLFGSKAKMTNVVVADNRVNKAGSGLTIERKSLRLIHTTIARNGSTEATATGNTSGILITRSTWAGYTSVALTNTILVSHGVGISVTAGNTVTLEGTLWGAGDWANGLDWGGDGTITTGTVNLWGDPAFVDPDAADYHIGPSSVAIDVGVNAGVVTDIDGDLRPDRCFPDLGADEFITGIQCKRIFLPLVVRTYLGTTGPHNRPPNLPFSPVPADNAINQSVDINLKWSGGDPDADSVTYDVFLEEDDSTPDRLACNNAANALCDPGTLNDGTYFWRVIARDEHGATRAGPVWEFDARWTLSNDPPWHGAVVNVVPGNHMGQSFVPFASVLRSVAFDVLTMNPGRGGDTLTMRIRSEDGAVMATASRYLEEGFNGWLSFELENGGIRVTPEQTLILELEDTGKVVFGWKYGRDTYADGSAIFFGSFRTDRDFFFRVNY